MEVGKINLFIYATRWTGTALSALSLSNPQHLLYGWEQEWVRKPAAPGPPGRPQGGHPQIEGGPNVAAAGPMGRPWWPGGAPVWQQGGHPQNEGGPYRKRAAARAAPQDKWRPEGPPGPGRRAARVGPEGGPQGRPRALTTL